MTAVDDRPRAQEDAQEHAQMQPQEFEALAAYAGRTVEGLRLEFIGGKLGVKAVPDGAHAAMIMWLIGQCMQQPELDVYTSLGLAIETYRGGRAIPDAVVVPKGHFMDRDSLRKEWLDSSGVLMTLEVTSWDRDTTKRDRIDKVRAYAESGIPVFMLVDRDSGKVNVYSNPVAGAYKDLHTDDFGETVTLPEPVAMELDTTRLKELTERFSH